MLLVFQTMALSFFGGGGVSFLDCCVAARGASHQADPLPGGPAGDLPLPELLGMTLIKTLTSCILQRLELTLNKSKAFLNLN